MTQDMTPDRDQRDQHAQKESAGAAAPAGPPPATRADLFAKLAALGIETVTLEHAPLHSVAEAQAARRAFPAAHREGHCKNLFLKDKKSALFLVVVPETRDVALQKLAKRIAAARLSFGRPELLFEVLGVRPGSVTPFALINDRARRIHVILDQEMLTWPRLHFHPLQNDATTAITPHDLMRFIAACGHTPRIIDFAALANPR